jgi:NAD(P) transhydrogenase subunit alpha
MNSSSNLINALFIFVLGGFIGFEVIRRVSPLLHTPLMSLTNALDAIAVVGAIVLVGEHKSTLSTVFGFIAVVAATSNIVGGFLITDRMLKMFKSSRPAAKPAVNDDRRTRRVQIVIELLYLIASVLFILSLKWMSSPTTARHGIWAGEIGMVLAIGGTLLHHGMDYR